MADDSPAPIRDVDAPAIAEAARVLCSGGLVAVPTETVYGGGDLSRQG
jgi:tRNA A37 threonylcarbamoyladenosine synthetase subunit TsaC/SUA5/YrdC